MSSTDAQVFEYPLEIAGTSSRIGGTYVTGRGKRREVLQLLVHGNSYDHRYWDAGEINGVDYSYVSYMAERGYDVLAVDMPGVGLSDGERLDGDQVDLESFARALAELISAARSDQSPLPNTARRVVLVGHSLGVLVCVHLQSRWPVADLLVSTGSGSWTHPDGSHWPAGAREAAQREPYAWIPFELRERSFYHAPGVDPAVLAHDRVHLHRSIPRRLWRDAHESKRADGAGVASIDIPVLIELGEHDPVMPAKYAEQERACWSGSPDVSVVVLPGVGHNVNLHLDHREGWEAIDRWISERA